MLTICGSARFAISCRSPPSARIKYNILIKWYLSFSKHFYFFFKKHILQISSDLYFILPDPPNLQEIAKHADNQHFHYSHPKPTPNGASLVFMLRCAAQKNGASLVFTLRCAAQKNGASLVFTLRWLRKKMVLRSSSCCAAHKKMVLRKKLCLLTADF